VAFVASVKRAARRVQSWSPRLPIRLSELLPFDRQRAGIMDIGNWPRPATAAVRAPTRITANKTTLTTMRPVMIFPVSE